MNNLATFEAKVEFIRNNIPNYQSIDPWNDRHNVTMIKVRLHEAGFYKHNPLQMLDQTVINLVEAAKGKPVKKNYTSRMRR